jgi:hypothetical protein
MIKMCPCAFVIAGAWSKDLQRNGSNGADGWVFNVYTIPFFVTDQHPPFSPANANAHSFTHSIIRLPLLFCLAHSLRFADILFSLLIYPAETASLFNPFIFFFPPP